MKIPTNRLRAARALRLSFGAVLFISALALLSTRPGPSRTVTGGTSDDDADGRVALMTSSQVQTAYGKLPLSFEANHGQTDPAVNFVSRGSGYTLFLTPAAAVFVLAGGSSERSTGKLPSGGDPLEQVSDRASSVVLRMKLEGANPKPVVSGRDELAGKVNSFIGNDPSQWHTNIPTFGRVHYESVYEGVDMVYYGNQQQLEYDFVVAPGADYKQIALGFEGASKVEVDAASGDLLLQAGESTLRQRKPVVYQTAEGARQEIESRYVLNDAGRIGFAVGEYDARRPLIIDPVLVYSTSLGGSENDAGLGLALDPSGNAYVTGATRSANFPTTTDIAQATFGGGTCGGATPVPCNDIFVTKLNAAGTALIYSTYLGGPDSDSGSAIGLDSSGNAYVMGFSTGAGFPTVNPFQATFGGGSSDVVMAKLNAAGSALIYSTYLGGSGGDIAGFVAGLAVDPAGNAYLAGNTDSANFPTTAGAFRTTLAGGRDAFATKMNAAGSALTYSTYLGGGANDQGHDITVDSSGNAYVTGQTFSSNFPTTAGAFQTVFGLGFSEAFVTKLNPAGSALLYSTFLGGDLNDAGIDIVIDSSDNAYVTGQTQSANFPTTAGAFQTTFGGGACGTVPNQFPCLDAFVTKLNATGAALVYSTFLGGDGSDVASGIALDVSGNVYLMGNTGSTNFPITAAAFQTSFGGVDDVFITKLNAGGSALIYSSYLGGAAGDNGREMVVDSFGDAYLTGFTSSTNFPTTTGAFQAAGNGGNDAFIAKFGFSASLANLSTRLRVESGDSALIGGFIVTGTQPKTVIIRAIGPSLALSDRLENPTLELYTGQTLLKSNDNWVDSPDKQAIIDSTIPPTNDLEAAIIATLPANGAGYTAVVRGVNNAQGIAVVQVYDLDRTVDSKLANISTRGFVQTGDNVLFAGMIVLGEAPQKVIIRATGPSLNIAGQIGDPTLQLVDANGAQLAFNDNWRTGGQEAEIIATTIPPPNNAESAIVFDLPSNGANYTAIVRGAAGTTGIAVVEVYALE